MKIYTKDKDISKLVKGIEWSGDYRQVSRSVSFQMLKDSRDKSLPVVTIEAGDQLRLLTDAGQELCFGVVFDIDKQASSSLVRYVFRDLLWYVNKSEVTKDFNGTPEAIAAEVLQMLGIEAGSLAATGITVRNPCIGVTGYKAIMAAYTAAARQNGKKYMLVVTDSTKVSVIEKGTECGVKLQAGANVIDASYKTSLQNLVNRVLITDKTGNVLDTVEDQESRQKYGTVQKILKQGDNEDKRAEAGQAIKALEHSASVTAFPDDVRAVAGYSVLIEEPETGLVGKFYIKSDKHTYESGKAQMSLDLEFENLMDEAELNKEESS